MLQRALSMPFWCVENPAGDPFGHSILDRLSSLEVCDLLCEARKEALIELTASHDDNLVPWDPARPEDDQDPGSETSRTLREIRKRLDAAGLRMAMITCDLHGDPVFRGGGLANPNPTMVGMSGVKELADNAREIRRDFIRLNVENFRLAEAKAAALAADRELAEMQKAVWEQLPAAAELLARGDWRRVLAERPDYQKLNGQAVHIARLDTRANRLLLGL
jgi:hypothetical protein